MTGGQMAPTSLIGQVTTTTPYGRQIENAGPPIRMAEMLATLEGTGYSARVAVDNIKNLRKAKAVLKKAFTFQTQELGFAFVEFLSACPTNWKMTSLKAKQHVEDVMVPCFPLGVFKDAASTEKD